MGCLGSERGGHCGDQKASAAMGAAGGGGAQAEEEEGHLSQMLLIVGELTLGYHNVEVIGTLGKVI